MSKNKKEKTRRGLFILCFILHHWMFRVKKFLSLIALMIGVMVVASLPTDFSVAQSFDPTDSDLLGKSFRFLMPNNPVYLYAITVPNTYTIYFDGNWNTSWYMSNMNMTYGQKENLLPNTFTKEWYDFQWWSTSEIGTVEYLDESEVKNLTAEDLGVVVLYAQWRVLDVPYTIEYLQENVAWTWYDLIETGSVYGAPWIGVILSWKIYTWFTLQTGAEITITSGWVVQYHYTRNTYNLTVKDRDKILISTWIKYWANIELPANNPEWTWNTFEWWDNIPENGKMPANDLVLTSKWSYGTHTITFDTNWWTEIDPITKNYGENIEIPVNPTKTWYRFIGWEPAIPDTMPYDDIVVKAIWMEEGSWKWWSGWWWRKNSTPDTPTWDNEHGSATDQNKPERWMEDLEAFFAYMWAHDMWIIETAWKDSDPDGYVTRWAMAEMVVKFSEKILGRWIPSIIPAKCAWWDAESEWLSPETKAYAEKSCAIWVMWIRMKDFMPNKILDRAEFGTILSRLLWWDKYDVVDATKTNLYYKRHLEALNEKKIMTQIDNPEDKKELRKWAWLMLMRSRIK